MKVFDLDEKMKNFLEDFDKFIDYLIFNEVTVGKVNKFISAKFLFEINEAMEQKQENITPKSTQLAYPLLHLFCNLSVGGKLFREEVIKGGKLALKPTDRVEIFKKLNNVEKYITLIEILWVDCNFEKLKYQTYDDISVHSVMRVLNDISSSKPNQVMDINISRRYFSTILLYFSYFGIMSIKENKEEELKGDVRSFNPAEIVVSPIGLKIIKILNKQRVLEQWNIQQRREYGEWKIDFKEEFYVPFKKVFKTEELKNTLPRGCNKFRDGIYTFKVYIDKNTWSKIKLDAKHTLHDLHMYIQEAFQFDNDHMYSFFMDGRAWSNNKFTCPYDDEGPHADEVEIGELELNEKQSFLYLFDYGDEWRFRVDVYDIEKTEVKLLKPQIIEKKGEPPEQYPDFDDEW
jgi:Plasmid pRiA4b ORF-3-like protein.